MSRIAFVGLARGIMGASLIGRLTINERRLGRLLRDPTGHPPGRTTAEIAAETKAAFEKATNEVKAIAEEALGKATAGEALTTSLKERADEALTAIAGLKASMTELEQKADRSGSGNEQQPSPGQQFIDSEEYKQAFPNGAQPGRNVAIEVKAITSLTTDADGSAGDLVRTERVQSPMAMMPDRRLTIRSLVAPGQTSSSSIEYVQETGFTNGAGMTAETTAKPESSLKFDLKQAPVRKIAHWMLASAEILADAPALRSMIDYRLRYGLAIVEDTQLLKGNGTGQNLLGVKPQAADYAAPITIADATKIDVLRLALLQVELAEYSADGHVLHPTDWAEIELLKDTLGRYIIGNPQGGLAPTLWGRPVVTTVAQTLGEFTVGAWARAAQLFDRMQSQVLVSTEDSDNFRKNMVTLLSEERLAFTVYRPEAFVDGAFPTG
ncbi:HK97 family phage major capsid protein [Novosphingobium sp. PhB55]|uniref:phage major capsid protein n=1 Tax=Novosphingobium sp. PhB55 TaxID=2485106 RepID=UPI0010EEA21F|nr:phage major capsid protein [Novosphingobium sp. PhB55]TDW65357.1 HK97 family phage major capsid protein [Novosphingobium sp. PhB55]